MDPSQIGTLSDAFTQTIDQLIQEIEDGNGGNIDWSAFGDYLNAQAGADAAAMQANNLDPNGNGSDPCSTIDTAINGLNQSRFNFQKVANDALRKLDKNIKPPPGGGGTNCDNIDPYDTTGDADAIPNLDGQINSYTGKPFPAGLKKAILDAAKKNHINPLLLYAIGMQETWLGTLDIYDEKDGTGDYGNGLGVFQYDKNNNPLNLVASDLEKIKHDVHFAAEIAAEFLSNLLKKHSLKNAIRKYNGGLANPKTATYLKHVCDFLKNADPTGKEAIKGKVATQIHVPPSAAVGSGILPAVSASLIGSATIPRSPNILPPLSASVIG